MGFNKRFLPDLSTLKESRKNFKSDTEFLKTYLEGASVFIGPSESMDYLKKVREEVDAKG